MNLKTGAQIISDIAAIMKNPEAKIAATAINPNALCGMVIMSGQRFEFLT
jgi:hypothetical protein